MKEDLFKLEKNRVSFTLATLEEIPEILDMMEAFYAIDQYAFDRPLSEKNLQTFLTNENLGRLWLIHSGISLIGYVVLAYGFSFEYKGRDAFIDEFFLKEAYRSKGIGKLTVDFVVKAAEQLEVKTIHLEAERHNKKALKLYEGKGFRSKGRFLLTKSLSNLTEIN